MAEQFPLPSGESVGTQTPLVNAYPLPQGGALGQLSSVPSTTIALTGARAQGLAGNLSFSLSQELTGAAAGGRAGSVGVEIRAALSGARARGRAGIASAVHVIYDMAWTRPAYRSKIIPSYLYVQYNEDDDLQAFVEAFNQLAQEVMTWLTEANLPNYTGPVVSGALLDWVALGLYGMARPVLPAGRSRNLGPYNTTQFNVLPLNGRKIIDPTSYFATTDDVFKRVMTWNFYKGDGKTFNVRWLKRRVMRFLTGMDGTDPGVDNTYQISVTFGPNKDATIRIVAGLRSVTGGALLNRFALNTVTPNQVRTVWTEYAPFEMAPIFKAAVDAGVLQLPFQYTWDVVIV
jgi:hypothetical protein